MRKMMLGLVLIMVCITGMTHAQADDAWSFDRLVGIAEQRAQQAYEPVPPLPEKLAAWDYDDYRKVWFWPDREVWARELPYRAAFFHRGFLQKDQMNMNLVRDGKVVHVPFDPAMFHYGDVAADAPTEDVGFAGFRLHYPMEAPDSYNEVIVFLGASYFRALGLGQVWGLSTRGLAIDTGVGNEEFPIFREAWIHEPKAGDTSATVDLLLDSPSVTGAYRIVVTPGKTTVTAVRAVVFGRKDVRQLCIAPLTSMFWFGEGQPHSGEFRPEVHDSDRLVVMDEGAEPLCRPLVNPTHTQRSRFEVSKLKRYGLLQRDRRFDRYEDLEAYYELRPSVWIEPTSDWGAGVVELLEIPTHREIDDNIVAYWVPAEPLKAGGRRELAYRVLWTMAEPPEGERDEEAALLKVTETFRQPAADGRAGYLVDFKGPASGLKLEGPPRFAGNAWIDPQTVVVMPNPHIDGWRVTFTVQETEAQAEVVADGGPVVRPQVRFWLTDGEGRCISEVWSCPPRP